MTLTPTPKDVTISREDGVAIISITRPDKKNALTGAMYDAMTAVMSLSANEAAIGAVVITGSNGVFTAGNDINDFLAYKGDMGASPGLRFIKALARFEKPLVAAVDGLAIGIGTTMLLHCDLVYASPAAVLKIPFVDLGLTPEGASSVLLPRRCGMARASELLLLGEAIPAERAEAFGLVNGVVPAAELREHAIAKAKALSKKPQKALAATRKMLRGDPGELTLVMDKEGREFAARLTMPEARAAFMAFANKDRLA
ncbi:Enoyl-CoA hydratase/carnithine racemase [Rhizobiales bacterium GAS113]|jgi:enoyl-CoA hydratase/carnithine racemase|nr:Enoyl-CoA hydratase/carnithine racemase [Rhizobiales bacterium GAS113]